MTMCALLILISYKKQRRKDLGVSGEKYNFTARKIL